MEVLKQSPSTDSVLCTVLIHYFHASHSKSAKSSTLQGSRPVETQPGMSPVSKEEIGVGADEIQGQLPTCTYDDPREVFEGHKSKIAKLEAKIVDLEAALASPTPSQNHTEGTTLSPFRVNTGVSLHVHIPRSTSTANSEGDEISSDRNFAPLSPAHSYRSTGSSATARDSFSPITPYLSLVDPAWPENLPAMESLLYYINIFYSSFPLANRILHRATFMASLNHHPSSGGFPHPSVLHAICALSSLYTPPEAKKTVPNSGTAMYFNSALISPPPPTCNKQHQGLRKRGHRVDASFGMQQAQQCNRTFYFSVQTGDRLMELLQAGIILTWYYYGSGRSVDVWVTIGCVCRTILPLGLNNSVGRTPLSRLPYRTLTLIPQNSTVFETEQGCNLFWLSYTMERLLTAGSVWPLTLHDEDISQVMPCKLDDFIDMQISPIASRQRMSTYKMLVAHPPEFTDEFSLYIKASIILGKVKQFNGRFKTKYFGGSTFSPNDQDIDIRGTAEFQALDTLLASFKTSFPKEFKEAISGIVNPILYSAHLIPHISVILLHDPHADVMSSSCISTQRLWAATRAIVQLVHQICATSFNFQLLDHSCSFSWFACGATLIRFLKSRALAGNGLEAIQIKGELDLIKFMLSHMGERTMVGLRQNKLLDELYRSEVESLFDSTPPPAPS